MKTVHEMICVHAAIFDHNVQGVLFHLHTSEAPGFATQDHDEERDLDAATGNSQDRQATSATYVQEGDPGLQRGPKTKPPLLTDSINWSKCHPPSMKYAVTPGV